MLKFIPPLPQIGLNMRMVFSFNKVYGVLVIVPAKMLSWYHKSIDQRQEFRPFADYPRKDLPCPKALVAELDLLEGYWLNDTSCLPDSISLTLKSINLKWFNNVKVCLRILGMLLVNTCTCDQSLSVMWRLKTFTFSTKTSERFNGRALMHVRQEIVPDTKNEGLISFDFQWYLINILYLL